MRVCCTACSLLCFLTFILANEDSELVDVSMDSHLVPTSTETHTPLPEVVTETAIKAIDSDEENFAALAGGAIAAVLLVLTCVIAMLLWCLSRHKGSYVTNEMDEDEDDNEDDESVGSDMELQTKEPLNIKEEE